MRPLSVRKRTKCAVTYVVPCKHLRVAPLNVATFGAAHLAVVGVVQSASSRCIAPFFHSRRCRRPCRDEHTPRCATPHANAGIFALHRNMHEARLASPSIVALNRRLAQVQRSLHGSMQMQASSHCIETCTRHVLQVQASSLWTADLHKGSVLCKAPCKCRHLHTASKHRTVSA